MFSNTLIIEEEMKDLEEARAEAGGVWNPGRGTAAGKADEVLGEPVADTSHA